jgi:hypothetical protein
VSCVPDFASVSGLSILECFLWCIVFLTNRHWQNQAHKTQDKQNTKTQYNTENKKMGNTTNGGQARCRWFLLQLEEIYANLQRLSTWRWNYTKIS